MNTQAKQPKAYQVAKFFKVSVENVQAQFMRNAASLRALTDAQLKKNRWTRATANQKAEQFEKQARLEA